MKATILDAVPVTPEIIDAWNGLVFKMERPEVFFTHQWALAASRAFSDSLRTLTFLVYESNRLEGVAAMAINRELPDTAFFLAATTADYCDIVSVPDDRSPVLAAVLEEMNKAGVQNLILANIPSESRTLQAIAGIARSHGFHIHERPAYDCRVISFGDEAQRRTILQSVMRKGHEKRGLKKLGELGPIQLTHLSAEQLQMGLRSIFRAQISRFLATNRLSPLIRPDRRFFLRELGELLNSAGWLKVSQLEVNGQPVAWNYGFRFFECWFWYLPTFQVQHQEASPGSCLLRLLTEEACVDPTVKRLDSGIGDEAYKERFSNTIFSTRYVQLSKSMPRHLAALGRHRLARSSRRFPMMEQRLRAGRDWVVSVQGRMRKKGVAASAVYAMKKGKRSLLSEDEVSFFEARPLNISKVNTSEKEHVTLLPLNWESIAEAAMSNADDEQTLEYLARCARRLRKGPASGYFLQNKETPALHFLWVDSYNGFHLSEIDSRLESNDPSAVMIFDCWTPAAQRSKGNYATAIRMAAGYLQRQQKKVWIFSAAGNEPSIRGIAKAGFMYRFSMVRRRRFGITTLSRNEIPI